MNILIRDHTIRLVVLQNLGPIGVDRIRVVVCELNRRCSIELRSARDPARSGHVLSPRDERPPQIDAIPKHRMHENYVHVWVSDVDRPEFVNVALGLSAQHRPRVYVNALQRYTCMSRSQRCGTQPASPSLAHQIWGLSFTGVHACSMTHAVAICGLRSCKCVSLHTIAVVEMYI